MRKLKSDVSFRANAGARGARGSHTPLTAEARPGPARARPSRTSNELRLVRAKKRLPRFDHLLRGLRLVGVSGDQLAQRSPPVLARCCSYSARGWLAALRGPPLLAQTS